MTAPLFMSPAHVSLLNQRLAASPAAQRLCAAMARDYVLLYVLSGNPEGRTEFWRTDIRRDHGVRFALESADGAADATISGDYWTILDAIRGKGALPAAEGDAATITAIGKILTSPEVTACAVAVAFPERSTR